MKRSMLLLLAVVAAVPALGADKWTKVQSRNFLLVGSASENQIRQVAESLEVFRTAYGRFFKAREGSSIATNVVVFKSDQAFKPFKPLYQGKPANVAGYFQSGEDVNYVALAADMQTPRVIYHEYVHRLMSDNLGGLPPWFQEGFAECFSTLEIEGRDKKVRIGRAIGEHVALLNERRFMPLERLFAVAHGSPEYNEESKQGLFYAQSWALVHYMMFNGNERKDKFVAFLDALREGKAAAPAFQEAFKTDLASFQKVFEAYITQRMAWNALEVQTPGGLDRSKDMLASPMSEAEAEFYQGDLMLHTRRLQEAETHLAAAIKLDANLAPAHSAMGRVHMRNKKPDEALGHLKKATQLDPGNYLSHYYYATALREKDQLSDVEWDAIRSELKLAVQLSPQFVEAIQMLASANISRNVEMPETVEMLARAIGLAPGRDYLIVQLAYALARTPQRDQARTLAQRLLAKPSIDDSTRKNAETLLASLDRSAAIEAVNRARQAEFAARDLPAPRDERERNEPAREEREGIEAAPTIVRRTPPPAAESAVVPDSRVGGNALAPGTASVLGNLIRLDCANGVTLSLTVKGQTVKLHSNTPQAIQFKSFNAAVSGQIACGALPGPGVPAEVVYRPAQGADNLGDPLSVTFVDMELSVAPLPQIAGTSRVTGTVTAVECTNGVSITISVDGSVRRYRTAAASNVAFINGPNPDGTVDCGPLPSPGLRAIIVYRPSPTPDFAGEPVVVQFQN